MHEAFNLGQLNRFPYYYELDFSGFDSSQTRLHYNLEMSWYLPVFHLWA